MRNVISDELKESMDHMIFLYGRATLFIDQNQSEFLQKHPNNPSKNQDLHESLLQPWKDIRRKLKELHKTEKTLPHDPAWKNEDLRLHILPAFTSKVIEVREELCGLIHDLDTVFGGSFEQEFLIENVRRYSHLIEPPPL